MSAQSFEIIDRIMRQADANGPCGPSRGSVHPEEYDALYWACVRAAMLAGRYSDGGDAVRISGTHGDVTLFSSASVPLGSIRWEPS